MPSRSHNEITIETNRDRRERDFTREFTAQLRSCAWHMTRTPGYCVAKRGALRNLNQEMVMSTQNKPQQNQSGNQFNQNQPKKQDETRKHAPNQGPDYNAPGRTDRTDGGERNRDDQKIRAPQK
jgi:hypothetical protein